MKKIEVSLAYCIFFSKNIIREDFFFLIIGCSGLYPFFNTEYFYLKTKKIKC